MKRTHRFMIPICIVLGLQAHVVASGEKDGQQVDAPIAPLRLSREAATGIGLDKVPWPDEQRTARWSFLFKGEELSVSVFESTPVNPAGEGVTRNRVTNYPYDQFVLVLSGKSVLIDDSGNAQTFLAGDYFVVPKGFTGIWEEHGVYRELIVIDEEAVRTRPLKVSPADK